MAQYKNLIRSVLGSVLVLGALFVGALVAPTTAHAVTTHDSTIYAFGSATGGATFQCRLDDAADPPPAWQTCDPAATSVGPLEDGTYDFEVRAVAPGTGATTHPPADWPASNTRP